ncbi:PAS domain-containing protein [Thermosediminibacter oceani]|uniref:PAS fold domain protein n=1 Tax=Thermosediminibacter oceani (strain ATCC BAA-1034 / DSM 16646 / JW/IW-1228P) TaxID=555079 RepID=D9S086_THEOJ|nr:PAS domain-containing protein [Thermosediminibacter oceani]ADL07014.1 PAS fold domain protein [Thermosediminibacter oceani DSM 16646]
MEQKWVQKLPVAITVCDAEGKILYMNEKACKTFEKSGGADLIGKNVLDCHPEPARSKLKNMLETQTKNCYTIEKNGVKKLIYQTPWYDENNNYEGFIEFSIEIPFEIPHYIRK